ncbi:MAG TPA: adenylate/guanylate cyclase domain-containing protein [Actinomycetota bacterium]|nr:adenylate/guanylate cyclase domain-containing protein [Actinomycetota bacterium]
MIPRIRLLGSVLVELGDSVIEERDLPGHRGRVALAFLVIERHRAASTEELGDLLWPAERPVSWEQELASLISRLETMLDRLGLTERGGINETPGHYRLPLTDAWVDAEVAVTKLEEARDAVEAGDVKKARRAATTAAEISGRSFLSGEEGTWIDAQRGRFRQIRTEALAVLARLDTEPSETQQPRRVLKTFMFTDIAGSTKLVELVGDDAWTDLVRWHDQTLRGLFGSHAGEEIDHAGDGFFVAFTDQKSACVCAIAIQRRLAEHRKSQGFAPKVRIGLHSAQANAGEGLYQGKGVHEAARIAGLAEGGQIVASSGTVDPSDVFRVADPRSVELRDVAEPVEVVTLLWD